MTTILLIHPPAAKPSETPPGIAALAGCLRHHGIACAQWDANLEGLLYLLEQVEAPEVSDAWSKRALKHRADNLAALRGPELYRNLDRYQRAVRDLNRALELLARRRPEISLSLSNYQDESNPLASDHLLKAAARPEQNPFFSWMEARLPALMEEVQPEWIGLSLCYLSQAVCTFALLGYIRQRWPTVKLALGGGLLSSWMSHPGWNDLFAGLVDCCIQGPGETALLRLLGFAGPIEDAPPDYSDLPLVGYLAPGPILPYAASRGCYWNRCSFCPENAEHNRYQPIAPQTAISQLAQLSQSIRPALIHLLDNALSPALLQALADQPPGPPWYGFVRFHEHLADVDFCRRLRASGCAMLKLGLESGSQAVLDAMDKGIRLELAERVFAALHQAGIATYVYLLFGTPTESLDEARETMAFIQRHHAAISFLNLAIFNMPVTSAEAQNLPGAAFSPGDLSLYLDFVHPLGWDRRSIRTFLDREFKRQPEIAAILRRDPPFFTSNHAAFFGGQFPWLRGVD